jgi:hypothetical protein
MLRGVGTVVWETAVVSGEESEDAVDSAAEPMAGTVGVTFGDAVGSRAVGWTAALDAVSSAADRMGTSVEVAFLVVTFEGAVGSGAAP